ncbi:MAG: preprotein translocase subunit SecG [Acidobacteria bacterium]|nr:preprotein translocase subunit SecG [Acidobacteriota bacterium]
MLISLLTALHVVVCALLVAAVLMQQGKGGDIAASFGGSGSQTAFGARAGASLLTRATTVLGALFMIGSMSLAIMGQNDSSSVLSGVEGPGLQPATPVTAPVEVDPAPETPTEDPAEEPAEPPAEPL